MNEARNWICEERRARGEGRRAKGEGRAARPSPLAPHLSVFAEATVVPYEDEDVLVDDDIGIRIDAPWKVVLYNDNIHTFDEVILQLQKALGCSAQRAENIAFEAHNRGKALAYSGEFNECFRVMGVLREIQLVVEIEG